MGLFSKDIKTMDDLFVHALQDVFHTENKIVKSMPKMIEKATNPQMPVQTNHVKNSFEARMRLSSLRVRLFNVVDGDIIRLAVDVHLCGIEKACHR